MLPLALDWDDNSANNLAGYNIYRSIFSGLSSTKINDSPITVSNYTDENLNNGTTYYYVVKAVDKGGNESDGSEEVAGTPEGSYFHNDP